jgi:hypothetical protein
MLNDPNHFFKNWRFRKLRPAPGSPDGLFSNQHQNFGYIFDGLEMEIVGIFNVP